VNNKFSSRLENPASVPTKIISSRLQTQRLFTLPLVRTRCEDFGCPFLLGLLSRRFDACVNGAAKANPVRELREKMDGFEAGDLDFGRFGVFGVLLLAGVLGFVDGVLGLELGVLGATVAVFGLAGVLGFEVAIRGLKSLMNGVEPFIYTANCLNTIHEC